MTKDDESPVIFQDDMAVISNAINGFGYRVDDHGNVPATATVLTAAGTTYTATGIIAQVATDVDVFRFTATSGGPTTIRVDVDDYLNDLNARLRLFDASGNLIATDDPSNSFDARLSMNLSNGDYYAQVSSSGAAGEAGQYRLRIDVPLVPPPPSGGGSGGGGGGGSIATVPPDTDEPNDYSDSAGQLGMIGSAAFSKSNLTIGLTPMGLPDYDWYTFNAARNGAISVTMSNSSLELSLFVMSGGFLTPIANGTSVGTGQQVFIQIKGRNTAIGVYTQGTYNLSVAVV